MTIPASDIVNGQPGVISAGGNPLSLNGVMLSKSAYLPTNAVRSLASADAVKAFFGPSSTEYALAQTYFLGFDNSTAKPGALLFAPYVDAARAAWLQSGSLASMTLAQLQALSGVLTIVVDGSSVTSSSINLATATSFSVAAGTITSAFSGGEVVCTWDSIKSVFFFTSATTGASSTIDFATGTLSAGVKATSATGAILSQGADVDTETTAMDNVKLKTQNWSSFMTLWEPTIDEKTAFAEWVNAQNQRYAYVVWDTDAQAIVDGSTTCFGYLAKTAKYDGVIPVYNTVKLAAFVLGAIASIDFSRTNGRITMKFKHQSGLVPTVTDLQTVNNLRANGYNFYGTWATDNDEFSGFAEGNMPGKWEWIDPYVNQIYFNSQEQLALMTLFFGVNSVPYNEDGYSLIRAAMIDPIQQFKNFGGIRAGVTLSELQKAQVNQASGRDVGRLIEQQGWYLQILDPGAQARGNRETPVINFWYTDGGSIHHADFSSIDIL